MAITIGFSVGVCFTRKINSSVIPANAVYDNEGNLVYDNEGNIVTYDL